MLIFLIGLLLLGNSVTDAQDASALSHNRNDIDIYSNSWGPSDYGFTVSGPEPLVDQALMEGVTQVTHHRCAHMKTYESESSWL